MSTRAKGREIRSEMEGLLREWKRSGDRSGFNVEHLYLGRHFQPELGFLMREAFRRSFAQGRFSPRPQSMEAIRRLVFQGELDYITDPEGRLETNSNQGLFRVEFQNGDQTWVEYNRNFEFLPKEFEISDGVILPVDEYEFQDVRFVYSLGPQQFLPSTHHLPGGKLLRRRSRRGDLRRFHRAVSEVLA